MFARWRNLAAAAGAIWFPFASALGSPDRDEFQIDAPCTRPGACAGYHDRMTANPWQTYERESWYQQYYNKSLDDPTSITDQPENTPNYESDYTTGNDDEFSNQFAPEYNEPEFPTTDGPAAVLEPRIDDATPVIDSEGRCDDPTCPCHAVIDLDSDDQPSPPNTAFNERPCPADHSIPGCFDLYELYSFEDESSGAPAIEPTPKAILTGTIEPIFEDCDEAEMDDTIEQLDENSIDSSTIFDGEAAVPDETATDAEEEALDSTDDADSDDCSSDENTRFHMFYPGCDWSPYHPVNDGRGTGATIEFESPASDSDTDNLQELTSEVD